MADKFLVAYAKIVTDKDSITLAGVFFGGFSDTESEAEKIARDCVNNIRGGTILPRVIPLEGDGQVIDALCDITERFERITQSMVESDEIINRTRKRR